MNIIDTNEIPALLLIFIFFIGILITICNSCKDERK